MLTATALAALRERLPADPDLVALLATLEARSASLLTGEPHLPRVKALLSRDGGFCPDDGATLGFDPWSPKQHRCPRCGRSFGGARHDRNWARAQHLWLAERMAEMALVGAVTGKHEFLSRANALLRATGATYHELPNRDNVLGPTRLFFSTYLESVWLTSWLAAAFILREAGALEETTSAVVDSVADEAAGLVASFNEGLSNRQTWHAAALTAIGAWFGDEELIRESVESRTGLLGHLAEGFGDDGLWYEGENYHLFALRGVMIGMQWAAAAGFDLLDDPAIRAHFHTALLGTARSALPDLTYPARRDARYGVSLASPASLDLWEVGRGWLGGDPELDGWLHTLYHVEGDLPPADHADYWLHDAGRAVSNQPSRAGLSWWALPAILPPSAVPVTWSPGSLFMAGQGLAILRDNGNYASLECGAAIGGHGHPDRLHLTLHAGGVHWLPDQGTGSYVHSALAWYRSALGHNAPLVDGRNAGGVDARLEAFDDARGLAWSRGAAGDLRRTIVLDGSRLVDMLEIEGTGDRRIELPWHLQGTIAMATPGRWEPTPYADPFARDAERFIPDDGGPVAVRLTHGARELRAIFVVPGGELLRLVAPGLPTAPEPRPFLLVRGHGHGLRWTTLLDWSPSGSDQEVGAVTVDGASVSVAAPAGTTTYGTVATGLRVTGPAGMLELGGLVRARPAAVREAAPVHAPVEGFVPRIDGAPALDGTLAGFDLSYPLALSEEHQYRRSEDPWNPETFSAEAWLNWDGESLYLAVAVSKPALVFRPADAPPLLLDNEADDIHSDGVQLHWHLGGARRDMIVIPERDGSVRVRPIGPARKAMPAITGRWSAVPGGYLATLCVADPALPLLEGGARFRFDLLVNEMLPERERRAGQLVWGGSGGWVYLRGDRHELQEAGVVTLG